jgi:ATP-dependent DNA ligase
MQPSVILAPMLFRPAKKRPGLIEPCIPTLVAKPPAGPQWVHEIKHDGYRLIARKQADRVLLFTRRARSSPPRGALLQSSGHWWNEEAERAAERS